MVEMASHLEELPSSELNHLLVWLPIQLDWISWPLQAFPQTSLVVL